MKGLCELKFVSEQVSFLILQTEMQTEGIYVMSANFNLEKRIVEILIFTEFPYILDFCSVSL